MDLRRFDYKTYTSLMDRLLATHVPLRFADLGPATGWPDRLVILRHDVDYSPSAALAMARLEHARGVKATYFLLLNTFYYNVLSPEWASVPRTIADLGHEIGLHYDPRAYRSFSLEESIDILKTQTRLLAQLAGAPVSSIATHQPGLRPEDPFRTIPGYLNAFDTSVCGDIPYFSDSCRAWRDDAVQALGSDLPPRFQLNTHPINWGERDRDRRSIFYDVHRNLEDFVREEGSLLWTQIQRHSAVGESERRQESDGEESPS